MKNRFDIGMHPRIKDMPYLVWFDDFLLAKFDVDNLCKRFGEDRARDFLNDCIKYMIGGG